MAPVLPAVRLLSTEPPNYFAHDHVFALGRETVQYKEITPVI